MNPNLFLSPARRNRRPPRKSAAASLGALVLALTGCASGSSAGDEPGDSDSASTSGASYPMAIEQCGEELTIQEPPQRVLTLAQPQNDMMAALGLSDLVVGTAQVSPPDGLAGGTPDADAESEVPVIAEKGVPAKEVTISQGADLVLAPTVYEFDEAEGFATEDDLAAAGATAYLAAGGCPEQRPHRSVEDNLVDLENLGVIFDREDRAQELAEDYRSGLDEVATAVADVEPVRVAEVFVFGTTVESLSASSGNDLVKAAGGENIFAGDDPRFGGSIFASLSAEVIAAEEPEAFVFSVGSEEDAEQVRTLLRETFPTTPAVQDDKLIAYSSTAALPGALTVPEAVRYVAEQLHPEAF